jgi:hypothetical protein
MAIALLAFRLAEEGNQIVQPEVHPATDVVGTEAIGELLQALGISKMIPPTMNGALGRLIC